MAFPKIREARQDEWDDAMDLVWATFVKFEADEYTTEGIDNFWEFITDGMLKKMFQLGTYKIFVAEADGRIIGVITLRNRTHISLLFVDEAFHRRGIGTALFKHLAAYVFEELGEEFISVNASPYGLPFYEAVGFDALGMETQQHGIKYTPMRYKPAERTERNG